MTGLRLHASSGNDASSCGHIGGIPSLPENTSWPRCQLCQCEMVSFLDIVLPEFEASPFQPKSRLQIFTCREHDDIAGTIYSDYKRFDAAAANQQLPSEYWQITDGHYLLRLLPPTAQATESHIESRLDHQYLIATSHDSDCGFKLFGEPDWIQPSESHHCCCGAPMKLLLQIPVDYGFKMAAGAEQQPNSFSCSEYCIFLGNQLCLLGCTKQCDPQALWPVLQN